LLARARRRGGFSRGGATGDKNSSQTEKRQSEYLMFHCPGYGLNLKTGCIFPREKFVNEVDP
jgi:hypothetical protein